MLIVWWLLLDWFIVPKVDNCLKDAVAVSDVARTSANPQKFISGANTTVRGAIIRGDTTVRNVALVFTGDEYADGGNRIRNVLRKNRVPASFFLTGRFYRNPVFQPLIRALKKDGHYLGAHSDAHLLYCDWTNRDSLLVGPSQFRADLDRNYAEMNRYGIAKTEARFFLPPYEWYNDTIAAWTRNRGLQLISYTSGTLSHADYTTPDLKNYRSSRAILQSIYDYEQRHPAGLNGFILLLHVGTHPDRTDKLYEHLNELLTYLRQKKYKLVRVNALIQ
ncbi:hypothetical protein GCM10027299_20570 [Larkinella ripae]